MSDDVRRLAPDTDSLARRIPYGTPAGTLCVLGPEGGVQVVPGASHVVTFGRAAADVDVPLGVEDPAVSRTQEVTTAPSPGYNRWSCVLGSAKEGAERVEVNLQFRTQFQPTGTIGAYRVRQTSGASEYGVSGCAVYVEVVHQAAVAPGRSEIVRFGSFGQAAYDDQCARAQKSPARPSASSPRPSDPRV